MHSRHSLAAFGGAMRGRGVSLERRDTGNGATVTVEQLAEFKRVIDGVATAWEAHKKAADEEAAERKKTGGVSPETKAKLDKIGADLDQLSAMKDRLEKVELKANRVALGAGADKPGLSPEQEEHKKAFDLFLKKGIDTGLSELERKAMSVGSDPDGGFFVPVDSTGRIVTRMFETSPLRGLASTQSISTEALEGLRDTGEAGAGWTGETGTRSESTTPTVAKWRIPAEEMYAEPRATQTLLDDAAVDAAAWLEGKIADRFARLENTAFVTGTGIARPRGFATYTTAATADATRTWGELEHVKSGANGAFAASAPADKLFDLIYAFKPDYLVGPGVSWATTREVLAAARKFKDGQGQYLWQPGLQQGQPQRLLDFPVTLMQDMAALATDSLSLALANFQVGYQIVDRMGIRVLRDPYTAKPYVKFYATKRTGGAVIQFEAIKFIKFAA